VKFVANRNRVVAGVLIRFLPLVLLAVSLSGALFSFWYFRDSERSARSLIRLQTEAVADAIDAELETSLLNLENHIRNWSEPVASFADETAMIRVRTFLAELGQAHPAFVFGVIEAGSQLERIGEDQNFTDNYIKSLDLFALSGRTFRTTGFTEVNSRSLDIWFVYNLKNASGEEIRLRSLLRLSRYFVKMNPALTRFPESIFVLKAETAKGRPQLISAQQKSAVTAKLPEIAPEGNMRRINVLGDTHVTWSVALKNYPASVIYAPMESDLLGDRTLHVLLFAGVALSGIAGAGLLVFRFSRRQAGYVASASDAINKLRLGTDGSMQQPDIPEFIELADAIGALGRSIDENRIRSRVVNKSMLELFACNDSTSAVMKCVELICTQCLADTAWFEPFISEQDFYRAEKNNDRVAPGWQWKNHRIVEIDREDVVRLRAHYPEQNVLVYGVKFGYESIGTLKAYYSGSVQEIVRLMLDSLVSILEKTLARHDAIKKGVLLSTELDFAKTIQKSIVSAGSVVESDPRIAQFYRPADRLGGDWFYVIQNKEYDGCYMIMGSVAGGGISQGLLTSGVKGGLDVLDHLIRSRDVDPFRSPAEIIPLLQRIVVAMNKMTDISITCFVAHVDFRTRCLRVANQRHSLPIIVRPDAGRTGVVTLTECSSRRTENGIEIMEATLNPGDFLVACSDGLTHAKGFKSEIFERFMVSAIEKSEGYADATALRDDLKHMYDYYTSSKKQQDDVCFMVVKVEDQEEVRQSA
jgi:serine phosphatase RsbU (regulator of sigma subunit)